MEIPVNLIKVKDRKRKLDKGRAAEIAHSITEIGLLNPITVRTVNEHYELVAGAHRLEAVKILQHETVEAAVFDGDNLDAELAEIDENLRRNDLTILEQGEHLLRRNEILAARGQRATPRDNQYAGDMVSPALTTEQIARDVGLSERSAQRRLQIARDIDNDVKDTIRQTPVADSTTQLLELARMEAEEQKEIAEIIAGGEAKNVKGAKKKATKNRKEKEKEELIEQADNIVPDERWKVFVGDIHLTEIEPGSLDAIITDPPYPKDDLPLWGELGRFAKRHLKVGGVLLAMTGSLYLPTIFEALGEHLTYQWVLACELPGQHSEVHAAWVNNQMWKAVLVYRNGGDLINIGSDLFTNDKRDKDFHEWGQGISGYLWQIERFTNPNDLICDPFLGGGTTGVAALQLKRRFIGFDNDGERVAISKGRINKALLEL